MKKSILKIVFFALLAASVFAQEVEKICVLDEIKYEKYPIGGMGHFPIGIYIDEVNYLMVTQDPWQDENVTIDLTNKKITRANQPFPVGHSSLILKLGNDYWGINSRSFECSINGERYEYIEDVGSGVCFTLKKDTGYIVYYVDESGYPCAIDTNGHIYDNDEAMAYLKKYDPEKYEQSEKRAAELELYNDFIRNRVLIWGNTYYTTTRIMERFYKKADPYIINGLIQYDDSGYGYQVDIDYNDADSKLCIVNPEGVREKLVSLKGYAYMLHNENSGKSTSWYVGFGGNIYYYISGENYTEVFRIRRTWGDPDFYAMAINGYTDDSYGKYVDKVLPTLSKADLRLLRNTIFAIYGVHFKSADLSAHFAKQVWYTDEDKTSGEVTLPAHRQKLVEMIQELERR